MRIIVKLLKENSDSTTSEVFLDGVKSFYSIEDEAREVKIKGETRVPSGVRNLALRFSPKFSNEYLANPDGSFQIVRAKTASNEQKVTWKPHQLIWVKDVPDFEYVLVHWGNTDDDTDGCLVIGMSIGKVGEQDAVLQSRACYEKYYPLIAKEVEKGTSTIEYVRNIVKS